MVRLQTGYIYHYAFAMLIGVAAFITWFMFAGRPLMASWPILSVTTFLPLVGALLIILRCAARTPRSRATPAGSRCGRR